MFIKAFFLNSYVSADGGTIFALLIIGGIIRWLWSVFTEDSTYSYSSNSSSSSFSFSGDRFRSKIKETTKKNDDKIEVDIYGKIEGNAYGMNPFMTSLSLKTYLFDDDVPFYSLNQRLTDMASESYMSEIGLGNVGYDQYLNLTKWVNVATVSKRDIVHPRKGNRSISAKSFLVDNIKQPVIIAGQPYSNHGIIKTIESTKKMTFDTPGYLDEIENNEEILCSIVDGAVTGGSVGSQKSRLDFDIPGERPDKESLTQELMEIVDRNYPVTSSWISDQELQQNPNLIRTMSVKPPTGTGQVRMIRIGDNIDFQPCGGTHVKSTGEVGKIKISKIENKGKQNRRINLTWEN